MIKPHSVSVKSERDRDNHKFEDTLKNSRKKAATLLNNLNDHANENANDLDLVCEEEINWGETKKADIFNNHRNYMADDIIVEQSETSEDSKDSIIYNT